MRTARSEMVGSLDLGPTTTLRAPPAATSCKGANHHIRTCHRPQKFEQSNSSKSNIRINPTCPIYCYQSMWARYQGGQMSASIYRRQNCESFRIPTLNHRTKHNSHTATTPHIYTPNNTVPRRSRCPPPGRRIAKRRLILLEAPNSYPQNPIQVQWTFTRSLK